MRAANWPGCCSPSASDAHPNGLANGSDQVGRNYMFHNSQAVLALSKEPNPTAFQKTLGVNDFYFGSDDFEYPMGNIQMIGKSQADMFRGEKPLETKLAPGFALRDVATHAVDFWLSTEDLPVPENRVTLERDGNVKLSYSARNATAASRLYHQLKSMLGHLGMHRPPDPPPRLPQDRHSHRRVAHQAGTRRFGTDPATSVLNTDCRAHELDNLYVVDTTSLEYRRGEPGADRHGQRGLVAATISPSAWAPPERQRFLAGDGIALGVSTRAGPVRRRRPRRRPSRSGRRRCGPAPRGLWLLEK